LYDGHGSTRQLVDSSEDITAAYSYDAYGNLLGGNPGTPQNPGSPATNLLYAGEQFDIDAQQYYLRARYYDPSSGRFNRLDPASGNHTDPQSLHKYLYCHANPVNGVDPTGEFPSLTALEQLVVTGIRKVVERVQSFYANHVAWRMFAATYRAFRMYQWMLYQLPRVWLALMGLDLGLAFLDVAATAWLNNNQTIPASHVDRGVTLHNIAGGNLGLNFPKIDDWRPAYGVATSIKTHGVSSPDSLIKAITTDLRAIQDIERTKLTGLTASGSRVTVQTGQIRLKCLLVGVPQNQAHWLQMQSFRNTIRNLRVQYRTVIKTVPVKGWKK
jgi:RHS repeat-associated protein